MHEVRAQREPAADGGRRTSSRPPAEDATARHDRDPQHQRDRRTSPTGSRRSGTGSISRVPTRSMRAVRRDRHAGREGEQDRPCRRPAALPGGRAPSRGERPATGAGATGTRPAAPTTPSEPASPRRSPNSPTPIDDRQQRRRPARDRVDDGEVATPVGGRQEDEVAASMTPETHAQAIPSRGSGCAPGAPPDGNAGRHDPHRRRQHPDRRRPQRVAGRLEPDVPGDVQHGRERDQADD